MKETRARVDRVMKAWNSGDVPSVKEAYADDVVWHHTALTEPINGLEALRAYIRELRTAFPDLTMRADEIVGAGDKVAIRWTWTGTHLGDWQGLAPTGRTVVQSGITVTYSEEGRSVEEYVSSDNYSLFAQLGLVPECIGMALQL